MPEFLDYLTTFLWSMVPVVELRGAIPWGAAHGLAWHTNYLLCVLGNLLPIPFILLFIRAILGWMKGVPKLAKIALWLEAKAEKKSDRVNRFAAFGLFLFVAVPLPGTGAWTGALVAALMEMRIRNSLLSILAGVLVAGLIMTGISYGFIGFLDFLK